MSIYFQLLVSLLLWSVNIILMKFLSETMNFISLSLVKLGLSFLCLSIYIIYKKIKIGKYIIKNSIIGFFMFYLNSILTMHGLSYIKGNQLAFLNSLSGLITIVLSFILLHKTININQIKYIICIIISFMFSIDFAFNTFNIGFIYMLSGLVSYNLGYILYRIFRLRKSINGLYIQLLTAFLLIMVHSIVFKYPLVYDLGIVEILLLITISGCGFIYTQYTYLKSIEQIGQLRTSQIFSYIPIFVFVLSLFIYGYNECLYCIIAILIIIIANLNYL